MFFVNNFICHDIYLLPYASCVENPQDGDIKDEVPVDEDDEEEDIADKAAMPPKAKKAPAATAAASAEVTAMEVATAPAAKKAAVKPFLLDVHDG